MSRLCVLYFYFQNTFIFLRYGFDMVSIWFRDAFRVFLYENEIEISMKHKKGSTNCEASFVMCYV